MDSTKKYSTALQELSFHCSGGICIDSVVLAFSACPICDVTVPSTGLEMHANNHFEEEEELLKDMKLSQQLAREDMELAEKIALGPTRPRNTRMTPYTPQVKRTGASKTLVAMNLSSSTSKSDVIEFFKWPGDVVDVRFSYYPSGEFRGVCHLEFATEEAAKKAMKLNGEYLSGSWVKLGFSRESIFVRGFDTSSEINEIRSSLKEHFSSCGEILWMHIPTFHDTGIARGAVSSGGRFGPYGGPTYIHGFLLKSDRGYGGAGLRRVGSPYRHPSEDMGLEQIRRWMSYCYEEGFVDCMEDSSNHREAAREIASDLGTDEDVLMVCCFPLISYLNSQDLLSVRSVCKLLCSTVRGDALLYTDHPLNEWVTDDGLLQLASRAQGSLRTLSKHRVCGNPHAIIRKYGLMCRRQCFRSNANEIGFIKVSCLQAIEILL
ncbi:hypothetical protein C5167_031905 [Papaver somniferum]|uniref:RRM domain-containing protein n=1 Tax=Papaver somniferum TaxID=3469 RepID=A0A4Y7K5N2_PAPSO|nr:hypothetical protein C5167_031905 [Papaver somniferum]